MCAELFKYQALITVLSTSPRYIVLTSFPFALRVGLEMKGLKEHFFDYAIN